MRKHYLFLLIVLCMAFSCIEETNPAFDEQSFTKIYDNRQFSANYFPIDIAQTEDGGYLILGGRRLDDSNFTGIYLLKVDKEGNFISDLEVDESYVNPIARMAFINNEYHFFCMDPLTLQVHIMRVDVNLDGVNTTLAGGSLFYPCAARMDGNNFVLLSYEPMDKLSVIAVVSPTGGVSQSKGFSIGTGEDIEEPIINHFIRTGRQYSFDAGRIPGGLYFFNGFFNYTFSLVFTNLTQDDPNGVVQGIQDDGGLSAVEPLGGNKFSAARFNFGDNFLLPNVNLNIQGISSSVDLSGNTLPELENDAVIRIHRATLKSKNVLIYASTTRSKQIGLYYYDEATGAFLSSQYLGFSNPFEVSRVISTADGGLAVCGTTYVAGRFPRIVLIKLNEAGLPI